MISSGTVGNGTPTRSSGMPMRPLPRAITRWSAAAARMQPPAIAWPFTAATTGFGQTNTSRSAAPSAGRNWRTYASPCSTTRTRSTPAEKIDPVPVITSAASGDVSNSAIVREIARDSSVSKAFALPCASVAMRMALRRATSIMSPLQGDDEERLRVAERRHVAADLLSELRVVAPWRHERPLPRPSPARGGVVVLFAARASRLSRPRAPAVGALRRFSAQVPRGPPQPRALRHLEAADRLAGVVGDRHHQPGVRRQILLHVEREDGAVRRIRRGPVARHRPEARRARRRLAERIEQIGVAQREEVRVLVERLRRHLAERRVVVEDVEAAAEGRDDEVALALLDREIADLRDRQAALERDPPPAAVDRREQAELGAGEQQ